MTTMPNTEMVMPQKPHHENARTLKLSSEKWAPLPNPNREIPYINVEEIPPDTPKPTNEQKNEQLFDIKKSADSWANRGINYIKKTAKNFLEEKIKAGPNFVADAIDAPKNFVKEKVKEGTDLFANLIDTPKNFVEKPLQGATNFATNEIDNFSKKMQFGLRLPNKVVNGVGTIFKKLGNFFKNDKLTKEGQDIQNFSKSFEPREEELATKVSSKEKQIVDPINKKTNQAMGVIDKAFEGPSKYSNQIRELGQKTDVIDKAFEQPSNIANRIREFGEKQASGIEQIAQKFKKSLLSIFNSVRSKLGNMNKEKAKSDNVPTLGAPSTWNHNDSQLSL